ncbi:hypothetical protein [Streptomyces griseosporeus]|uniref:hypothetical protein n=1 Tax=Streptomyces griseosporeus TaxID=1910 RepID=UPI00369B5A22
MDAPLHSEDADTEPEDKDSARAADLGGTAEPTPEEEPAPEAWEAIEQLFALAPHLRSGRANVMGDTQVSGDVVAGDKRITVHLPETSLPRLHSVGPLPTRELAHLSDTFAPSRRYYELCAELATRRVLVLRGRPDSGRRTAALRMLLQVGTDTGEVIALDPGTDPADLADHVRPGGAHVVVDPVTSQASPLREVHLHAIHHRLGEDGLFIAVITHGTAVEDVPTYDWEPPPAADIATAHLLHAVRHSMTEGETEARETVRRLLELKQTIAYLSSSPSPREAVGYARLLVEYGRGRCDDDVLARYGRTSAEEIVDGWFGEGHDSAEVALRDKAFMISLAVFDGLPYPLVAELGDELYRKLRAVEEPDRTPGCSVFGPSPADRLALARAQEYEDETDSRWGRLPERVVAFRDGSLWNTVLSHVWAGHPAVRKPLLAWLDTLAEDRRTTVRLRAAVASGVLAAADFGYAFDSFLERWGSSARPVQRQLAAWALYTAAEHGMDVPVRRLLADWSRRHHPARRWTVARAYALLGGATVTSALRDIGLMAATGPEPDAALRTTLEQALEALLQGPAAVTVLERLVDWHDSRGPLQELAAAGFLRGARRRIGTAGADGATWPRLLWLADRDPRARWYIVTMWRALLGNRASRDMAREELARWIGVAERASARAGRRVFRDVPPSEATVPYDAVSDVESALASLLPQLVKSPNDWERLDHLLRRVGTTDGLQSPVTARLRAALADRPPALPSPL